MATGLAAQAQESVEQFYSGKTLRLIIGFSAGGGYDQYARLVARHLPRFIPGSPAIIAENMPGGGSRVAANYLYTVAPKDGTVLGTIDHSLPLDQAMGDTSIAFDMSEFNFIGTPVVSNNVLVTWHTSGVTSIDEARQTAVPIASTGSATTMQYPTVMNTLLGTKFDIIVGYQGGNDMDLAMEQQEVGGRGSNSWSSYKAFKPDWIEQQRIHVIAQIGLRPEPDLPDAPLLVDLAENDPDAEMLRLLSLPVTLGRPLFTTPGVPPERLEALRAAFDAMVVDKEFRAAAAAESLEISPTSGVELQQVVSDIVAAPAEVGRRLAEATGTQIQ